VCKPWLYGEFGTTAYSTTPGGTQTVVNQYGRQLLWSQAIAANETSTPALISAKQDTYTGIATQLQQKDPGVYSLFQGNQWTTRLEIAFAALFAALVAGLLILLIALTLIVLKLGFLLLLVAGPFFLIVGTHPGFGRVIAIRWFEMLVGVLMKQVAIAIVLSVLLYCYSLIMGTTDAVLPWALKILMIALVTVAVFIYRKPFQHLFSAVGYGTIGSQERAEYSLREAGSTFRRSTLDAATVAVPGVAGYRAARWARRNPGQAAALAGVAASGANAGAGAGSAASAEAAARAGTVASASSDAYASRLRPDAPPPADGEGQASSGSRRLVSGAGGAGGAARNRHVPEADSGGGRAAPPLDLPPRGTATGTRTNGSHANGTPATGTAAPASGWSRGAGRSASAGTAGPLGPVGPRSRAPGSSAGAARGRSGSAGSPPPISRSSGGSGGNGGNGRGGSSPAWPASGWTSAGVRQRSGPAPKPAPAEPEGPRVQSGSGDSKGQGDAPPSSPFWLRPRRRDK
jgi:hypothetical protein